jgi:ABC-type transport system involved in multi-copper enzyme maturation permease subunit
MTAYALPAPRLVGADLLKLRKRRSLTATVAVLTVGAVVLTFAVMELMHLSNPAKHGPAGGVQNLGHVSFLIAALGAAAAALVGAAIGAGDEDAGVYRDLVVTGRSRVALFLSRIPAGLAYLLPFVAAAYAVAATASVVFAGDRPVPSAGLMVEGGLWALLQTTFYFLLALGVAALLGSRSQTIGIVLAWRLALTPILASISALGVVRELVPGVALQSLDPSGFGDALRQGPNVGMSIGAVAAVLLVWTAVTLTVGGWRDTSRDA